MTLDPLLNAASPIPTHAILAIFALILGAIQLWRPKGGKAHKIIGRVWVILLTYIAISSFFIHELRVFGPFSPIHILSILVLIALFNGIRFARVGRIEAHKRAMTSLFWYALVLTGAFTFFPGRIMYRVLFGDG